MLTKEQLEERRSGFGGDDAPALFGMHEFKTALEVVGTKLGVLEPEDLSDNDFITFGNLLEDTVAAEFARRNSCKVRRINKMLRSKEHSFMIAHIDRDIVECPAYPEDALEIKTSGNPREWGRTGTDQVPDRVILQVHHYFGVNPSWQRFHIGLLLQGNEWRQYHIRRDPKIVQDIVDVERDAWESYVVAKKLPEPQWEHRTTKHTLERLFGNADGTIIEEPEIVAKLAPWHTVISEAQEQHLAYEKLIATAKNHVANLIGKASGIKLPGDDGYWIRRQVKKKGYVVEDSTYQEVRLLKKLGRDLANA
jgi:putative phage-type endonuclease